MRRPLGVVSGLAVLVAALTAPIPAIADTTPPEPAAEEAAPTWNHPLPFGAGWALKRGIDLPNPFGAGLFLVYMSRDFEVKDVRVTLPGNEPVSVANVATFDVRNHTALAAVKVDAWVLPILNLYGLVGHSWTDTRLNATVTLDPRIGGPVVIDVTQDSEVGGPLVGVGATMVAGYGPWFILGDANFNYADIDIFDDGIAAWFLSARTGWSGSARKRAWRAWVGAAYLAADRTVTITETAQVLGEVKVEVDQRPVHPLTYQAGGSLGFGKRWETMLELGSNFDDAFVGVMSATYRF